MINTFGTWGSHIPDSPLSTTINYVITGATIDSIQPYTTIFQLMDFSQNIKVLDFGCGVGRNAIPLALKYTSSEIFVYDNPKMVKQMREFCKQKYKLPIEEIKNLKIYTEWDKIKTKKFDYIYATLVFQHIKESDLNTYLQDIKYITNNLIVFGRRFNDDSNKNTWSIIENNGLYPINIESYQRDGNDHEHQMAIYKI